MISHRWHETVIRDHALQQGEWAGVRPSDRQERKVIGAGTHDTCNTFVLQGCGHVLRLIIASTVHRPSFLKRLNMEQSIRQKIAEESIDVPQPFSSSVFATALALAPSAVADLHRVQQSMRCANCSCVLRSGGPVDGNSQQGAFARAQVANSEFIKRNAR
ncbi:Hypothetical protein NGAL_HAMBI2605_10360 [Neorhizobium galegae bv. orientalis]|nr:Hypothetical protein NGAL_HAMBI2605_10360 [Neorhizobium galegae bv. orientalis]